MQQIVRKVLRCLVGAGLVFGAYYAGLVIAGFFALPLPGPLAGLLLLLMLLFVCPSFEGYIASFATTPLQHMSVLFVPAVLGVSVYWSDIKANGVAIFIAIFVTTLISLAITAWFSQTLFLGKARKDTRQTKDAEQSGEV